VPSYLLEVAYTPEAWASLIRNPQDRIEAVRPAIEGLGGKIVIAYFAFGEYDLIAVAEYPDNISAGAFSMAASAGGAVKALKTTPLMSINDGVKAMRKAATVRYKPPIAREEIGGSDVADIGQENIADALERLGGNP
jgi:uncharacterized protein with GYD domain